MGVTIEDVEKDARTACGAAASVEHATLQQSHYHRGMYPISLLVPVTTVSVAQNRRWGVSGFLPNS